MIGPPNSPSLTFRFCSKCKEGLQTTDFYKGRGECKECTKKKQRDYTRSESGRKVVLAYVHGEKGKAIRKKWRQTDNGKVYIKKMG